MCIRDRYRPIHAEFGFWATVCKMVRLMLSDRCLSVLSVTLVYCGQTVGWIKTKLAIRIGLGPGHIFLGGEPAPPPQRGIAPNFRPISVAAKWLHGSRCHLVGPGDFVLDGDPAPSPKGSGDPQFAAHVYCGQTTGWIKMVLGKEVGLSPGDLSLIHI